MQGDDITRVLVEGVGLPAFIDEFFGFPVGVVKFDRLAQLSRSVGVARRRNNAFLVPLGIVFPPV